MKNKTEKSKISQNNILVRIQQILQTTGHTCSSVIKILLLSKPTKKLKLIGKGKDIVILANGPSAKDFLKEKKWFLEGKQLLTVNFAVQSPFFSEIKPAFHVVADPILFSDEKMAELFDCLAQKVNWPLTLFLPYYAKKYPLWPSITQKIKSNTFIKVQLYNMTKINGSINFLNSAVIKGWGLPCPRNVLVPSIAHCLRLGFSNIYLAGADHSWTKLLWVDDKNQVMIDDKHFYDSSSSKINNTVHQTASLYLVLESISLVLQSYQKLNLIAKKHGIHIYNITPESFIDVFNRLKI